MADTKISGLPASTVPLGGTEVLPIVQGTTTKKVSIANVTAGRAISTAGVTDTSLTATKPVFTDANKKLTSSGTLGTDQGGTNLTSFTANGIVYASSTSALTTGSAITFDGTNFSTTGTATAAKFIPTGTSATGNGMYLPTTNTLAWSTNSTEKARLTSDGYLLVGTTYGSGVNVIGTNPFLLVNRNIQAFRDTVNNAGPSFGMLKTRAALGVFGIVADNDVYGRIDFAGDNGVNYNSVGAQIRAEVNGTPSSTSMPGRLMLLTTGPGEIAPTERVRIHASGGVSISNTTDPGLGNLRVNGKIKTGGYTVATLPAGVVGDIAYVTDATAPTYLGALVGGGAITCPVFFNGVAWVSA